MCILYILENVAALSAVHCDVCLFVCFFPQAKQVINCLLKLQRHYNQIKKKKCCRHVQGCCCTLQTELSM